MYPYALCPMPAQLSLCAPAARRRPLKRCLGCLRVIRKIEPRGLLHGHDTRLKSKESFIRVAESRTVRSMILCA